MASEALEERFSSSELRRLRAEAEGLRERLVSTAMRGGNWLRRRVTVGRTPLGECLRELAEAQRQWEAAVREEEEQEWALRGEEAQVRLLNLLEKGLALIERVQALREGPRRRRTKVVQGEGEEAFPSSRTEGLAGEVKEKPPPGPAPQEETHPREEGKREGAGGELKGEEDPREEEGHPEHDSEGGDTHEGEGDSGGEGPDGDEVKNDSEGEGREEEKDKSAICDDLLEWMEELEQEADALQDPSQKTADPLRKEAEFLKNWYINIRLDMARALKDKALHLWSAIWLKPLQAMTALQEALSQFPPLEVDALKAESDSLEGFLQATQSKDTLQKLTDYYCSLNSLLKMGLPCSNPLNEAGAIKWEMGSWCSVLLRVLLREGQKKTNALQEKVDAVQGISPEQAGALKVRMGALQKQMGLLWEIPLKEMMALLVMAYRLSCKLCSSPTKEDNTIWKNACDLVVSLKAHLKDVPQDEGGLLCEKVADLEVTLHDIPVEKLVALEEKVKVCDRKVDVLQNKIWKPLDEELEFLKEKLHSLKDSSDKELGELQKELDELQAHLVDLTAFEIYPLKGTVNALEKKMNALQKNMNVSLKASAPLEVRDEAMQVDKTGFSEMLNAQEAGTTQGEIDQLANKGSETPCPSSFGTAKCSGGIGNFGDSASTPGQHSSTGLRKTWHKEVNQEERSLVVQRFAETISPNNDSEVAKKILEACARQIEEEVYILANSKKEYHQLMAEKCTAINRKLDETLWSPSPNHGIETNEQPALEGPSIQPPGVLSVAATTGKAQPSKLLSSTPPSAAQKRPPSKFQVADDPSKALQIPAPTTLNRPRGRDPPQPEGTTCAESSEESLADCEPDLTKGESSEPPHKKQRTNPAGGTQEPSLTQELFSALQKYVTLTIKQNMERVSDMVSRVHGTDLKDTEEVKALIAALKKALALLKSFFEDA